jgi:hypothetical protein
MTWEILLALLANVTRVRLICASLELIREQPKLSTRFVTSLSPSVHNSPLTSYPI